MPRKARHFEANVVYHVLNRAAARQRLFRKPGDYAAFETVLEQAVARTPVRLLTYVLMPTHFHLVLWPAPGQESSISDFMRWLQLTHTQRWHAHYHSFGAGHLYQGRFKSFPVQSDGHTRILCKYVERNPVRAKLAKLAQHWQWSALHRRLHGTPQQKAILAAWPRGTSSSPERWLDYVNAAPPADAIAPLLQSLKRDTPFGDPAWQQSAAISHHLQHTLRPRGRPRLVRPGGESVK
ncbi:MAG TPA: transposase [Phycisphaerae bacterium]|nr:transposase [Phycisphaerae bacterium]